MHLHIFLSPSAGQTHIYFVGAGTKDEAIESPFVERLLKKGYEVLYLVEPIDEYCIQSLPEFDGKKFQNVAKEGLEIDSGEDAKKKNEEMAKDLEPLLNWLKEDALKVFFPPSSFLVSYFRCFAILLISPHPGQNREGGRFPASRVHSLRSRRLSIRLVGQYGENHEGAGLQEV